MDVLAIAAAMRLSLATPITVRPRHFYGGSTLPKAKREKRKKTRKRAEKSRKRNRKK